jgi:hypothetical protein
MAKKSEPHAISTVQRHATQNRWLPRDDMKWSVYDLYRWGHWIFFQSHYGPGVDSAKWVPGIFLGVKGCRRVRLTTSPSSVSRFFYFSRRIKWLTSHINFLSVSRDSYGYGLDDQGGGISRPGRVKYFHFSISSRPTLGSTQLPIKMGTGGSFPGVKRQGREADHSPPTSAEVKKMCIYTSIPHTSSGRKG